MSERDDPGLRRVAPEIRLDTALRPRPLALTAPTAGTVPRRTLLTGLTGVAAFAMTMGVSTALRMPSGPPSVPGPVARHLDLIVAHTGETFSDVFAEGDRYDTPKLARLSKLLRDYQNGEVKPIDPALFDLMARIQSHVGQPLRVLSGYRSWRTNRFMYLVGMDVAEHSQHVAAKAVDFTVPGIPAAKLGEIARRSGAGGVGVYRSGFVHVDTASMRDWTG